MHDVYRKADLLPEEWDRVCARNIYMSREFLSFMEKSNPCNQSYHLFKRHGEAYAAYVMFERKFNLFIFTRFNIQCNMKFVYLPLSVSHPGWVHGDDLDEIACSLNAMKGIKIVLNTADEQLDGFSQGDYLPVCVLDNRWKTFDEYLSDMRSGYRRRINQAMKKGCSLSFEILDDNSAFDEEMYSLYEQVFDRSEYSLEKLSLEFFKNTIAKTVLIKSGDDLEGFIQIVEDHVNSQLIFEFTGYDYAKLHEHDLYYNILTYIVKYGIENGFDTIQLGQTAYDAKLKMGSEMQNTHFLLSHSNSFINSLIAKHVHFLEYDVPEFDFHVFKEEPC